MGFVKRILATIRHIGLIAEGDGVVVAVSGGSDSVSMLHALCELAGSLGCRLHVAHLDHGLRGESAAEAAFVANLAQELGLPAMIDHVDVPQLLAESGGSTEHVARSVRYEFLRRVAGETGAGAVATAHTADDQVETILHNILRGTGLRSLGGMRIERPIRENSDVRVIRPLFNETRVAVLAYLAERHIDFCCDPSNADMAYTRNRIRHELLPMLEDRFNPSAGDALLRVGQVAQAIEGVAMARIESLAESVRRDDSLCCSRLLDIDPPVRLLVLEAAMGRLLPGLQLSYRHVGEVAGLVNAPDGAVVTLPSGRRVGRNYGRIEIMPEAYRTAIPPLNAVLDVPGKMSALGGELEMSAELIEPEEGFLGRFVVQKSRWEELLDADRAGDELRVRWRRDGDRFQPLGGPGTKKLQDFFVDAKVTAAERRRTPLVVGAAGILWVVGHRIDERVRVTDNTTRMLLLKARLGTRNDR